MVFLLSERRTTKPQINNANFIVNHFHFFFSFFFLQENGFFVESGAFDGEYLSNSLFFERERRWTGLLVEPVSDVYTKLRLKHRKSFCVRACLNEMPYPAQVLYMKTTLLKKSNLVRKERKKETRGPMVL